MGRQAYLTRLALGRSAFEVQEQGSLQALQNVPPAETTASGLPTGEEPATNSHIYEQQYDDRGHPINPASREHGRMLREAQNDVLAAIGVVERRTSPLSEDDIKSLFKKIELLDNMESENAAGELVSALSTLSDAFCTWWIISLRDRILTFRVPIGMPFATLVYTQYSSSGFWTFCCSGLPAYLLWSWGYQTVITLGGNLRLLDGILLRTNVSRRTRSSVQRVTNVIFRTVAQVAFYPLYYHSVLQMLHLLPIRPFLPPLAAFVPFAPSSPIQRVAMPSTLTSKSLAGFVVSLLASPLLLEFIRSLVEKQVQGIIHYAVESRQIQVGISEWPHSEESSSRFRSMIALRRTTWSFLGKSVDTVLSYLRRAYADYDELDGRRTPQDRYIERELERIHAEIEVGSLRISNLNRLDVPLAHAENVSRPVADLPEAWHTSPLSRPVSPVSQTISEGSQNAMDPSVRITSREDNDGIVELEVRLPQVASTTHEGLIANAPATREGNDGGGENEQQWVFSRGTKLSTEPSRMLGALLDYEIVTWATMPLHAVALRLVASTFHATHPQAFVAPYVRIVQHPLLGLGIGHALGRVLLCGGIGFMVDLAVWGCECSVVTWLGRTMFGWRKS